jgi:hypothetical protein
MQLPKPSLSTTRHSDDRREKQRITSEPRLGRRDISWVSSGWKSVQTKAVLLRKEAITRAEMLPI